MKEAATVREEVLTKVKVTDQEEVSQKTALIVPVVLLVKTTIFQEGDQAIQVIVTIIQIAVVSIVNVRTMQTEEAILTDHKDLFSEVLHYLNLKELMADNADQGLNAKVVLIMVHHLVVHPINQLLIRMCL